MSKRSRRIKRAERIKKHRCNYGGMSLNPAFTGIANNPWSNLSPMGRSIWAKDMSLIELMPPELGVAYDAWKKCRVVPKDNNHSVCMMGMKLFSKLLHLLHLPHLRFLPSPVDTIVVKLHIPEDADRVCPNDSNPDFKCRARKAIVIGYELPDGTPYQLPHNSKVVSYYDTKFEYHLGDTVYPTSFNGNPKVLCSGGIHHYMYRKMAVEYPA